MATFYVLPPRSCLEQILGDVLNRLLPGLPLPVDGWDLLMLHLAANSGWSKDLYLLSRDDLPEGEPVLDVLRTHFGAEAGDRVVEVPLPRVHASVPSPVRSWIVPPVDVSAMSGRSYNEIVRESHSTAIKELV